MSQKDQMETLELIFGKRGANVGSSVIQNMAEGEKALEGVLKSSGSAMAENERVLESIQGKIAQFQASYQAVSNTIINSNFIKVLVDSGTDFLSTTDDIISKFGLLTTTLTTASGLWSGFTNKGWLKRRAT